MVGQIPGVVVSVYIIFSFFAVVSSTFPVIFSFLSFWYCLTACCVQMWYIPSIFR